MTRVAQSALIAAGLSVALVTASALPAAARGGHGPGHGFGSHGGMHGAQFSGGHRHGDDAYTKAASDEEDKLLNTRLKSICRGC